MLMRSDTFVSTRGPLCITTLKSSSTTLLILIDEVFNSPYANGKSCRTGGSTPWTRFNATSVGCKGSRPIP